MISALYIGATGMKGLSQGMQVTTNNLANVSTIGYKAQDIQYSDLIYTEQANMGDWWCAQQDSRVALGQVGHGLRVDDIRTLFKQGAFESSNTVTDMAINGKGFFQVSDDLGRTYYTRAGDFRQDNEGYWRNPEGLGLNGYAYNADGVRASELSVVQVDKFSTIEAHPTSSVKMVMNLNSDNPHTSSDTDPYFSLMGQYNSAATPSISNTASSYTQGMTLYDGEGRARSVNVYFDGAASDTPDKLVQFVVATDPLVQLDEEGKAIPLERGDGLLMSGVLQFDASGKLIGMSAFTPSEAGSMDLENWVPASLSDGLPQFDLDGATVSLDFGVRAPGGWTNSPANAAAVGTDQNLLPSMGEDAVIGDLPSTAFNGTSPTGTYEQNGYGDGTLSRVEVGQNGVITGYYSNGKGLPLYQIPVVNFTSEYNLRREGNNLFSYDTQCGEIRIGDAGSENFGTIHAYQIEESNVDTATEMVNLITTQRGFQSNSKVVTTADQLLQRAIDLKRS